jgi:CRP/FNR family nitrogen fixation transcriptional regulator
MNANRVGLNIGEPVWTHERVARSRSIQDALESLAIVSRYQRDEEIYPQQGGVECWYRVVRGAARRFSVCADGRRQIVDLLLPEDFFGFGARGTHAFTAEAITADTVIARYPTSRIETLAASEPRAARELSGIVLEALSRLHSLLLILGRTTAEQKVGLFLLYMQERVGNGEADRLALPISRYDIADFLALSVETVSRSLSGLKERGVIALSGPRDIGIIDRDALAEEHAAAEGPARRSAVVVQASSLPQEMPRSRPVEVRIPRFAFGNVLGNMRRWLDQQHCDPSRFTCVSEGSGAVIIRVDFANESEAVAKAFAQQFASSSAMASG